MPILRSLTNTPPRVSTALDPPDYLPIMILKLTDRLAVDSLVANNSLRNVRFPPFEIPPTTSLPQREPARHTYEEVRKWKEEDSFVKLQAEHPDKILLAAKDHFPHLEFQEEPSSGPFRVVRLTQNGLATAQAQSRTIEAFFDNLDLTAEDLTQVPHEALNWWFKPPIGHRLYHGNFYFNRFEVIPLVYDPRRFTKKGWNKYQGPFSRFSFPVFARLIWTLLLRSNGRKAMDNCSRDPRFGTPQDARCLPETRNPQLRGKGATSCCWL